MSTTDEQEIRDRLRSALDEVPPAGPPAVAIVGQGRSIRRRRRISARAALAAVIGLGVALPGLIRPVPAVPAAAPAYHVTVNPPRSGDPAGLLGSGTVNGRPWRVNLTGSGANTSAYGPGLAYAQAPPDVPKQGDGPVLFETDGGPDRTAEYGAVRADVTMVTMRLAARTPLTLHPVAYRGVRWRRSYCRPGCGSPTSSPTAATDSWAMRCRSTAARPAARSWPGCRPASPAGHGPA